MDPQAALDKSRLTVLLKTKRIGRQVRLLDTVSSTNDIARQHAEGGVEEGLLVWAKEQTGGRGRSGRIWFSPAGKGLWFSVILRPTISPIRSGMLQIAAAVAVAEAVKRVCRVTVQVKWPNDLLLAGKKFCGILSEAEIQADRFAFLVLGIGINVSQTPEDFPEEIRSISTSLLLHTKVDVDQTLLLSRILHALERRYDQVEEGRTKRVLRAWRARCSHLGAQIRIDQSGDGIEGVAEDIDEDGSLLVRTSRGDLIKVVVGDCHLIL